VHLSLSLNPCSFQRRCMMRMMYPCQAGSSLCIDCNKKKRRGKENALQYKSITITLPGMPLPGWLLTLHRLQGRKQQEGVIQEQYVQRQYCTTTLLLLRCRGILLYHFHTEVL